MESGVHSHCLVRHQRKSCSLESSLPRACTWAGVPTSEVNKMSIKAKAHIVICLFIFYWIYHGKKFRQRE